MMDPFYFVASYFPFISVILTMTTSRKESSTTKLLLCLTIWYLCILHFLAYSQVQIYRAKDHFQSCYCKNQVGQVGIDNKSSETYCQVIIFAWMNSPEGIDCRYTKIITGVNVGSTASVARNSHAMVTFFFTVIFFTFSSRHQKGILFKGF